MECWSGRVAMVTGASSGIGAAIVEHLVKAGMITIGCARNIKPIQDLADKLGSEKGKLIAIKCDLTRENEILSMFENIESEYGGVDVCINNAGIGLKSPLLSGKYEDWRNTLDVNVMALAICSQEAFKSMKARGVDDGMIIHINSIMGHNILKISDLHFYTATKHAVRALLEGMRNELREMKSNIRVSEVSPGVVATDFYKRMHGEEAGKAFIKQFPALESNDLADAVTYIMATPNRVAVHDIIIKATEESF